MESLSLLPGLIGLSLDLENCVKNSLPLDLLELDGLGELLRGMLLLSAVEGTAELLRLERELLNSPAVKPYIPSCPH